MKTFLKDKGITPLHGRPAHPQPQGKIERYHRSLKNVVKLEHCYTPEELTAALSQFVHYYNHERSHESLDNVTPADVYFGKRERILKRRVRIKQQLLQQRRRRYLLRKPILSSNHFLNYSAGGSNFGKQQKQIKQKTRT